MKKLLFLIFFLSVVFAHADNDFSWWNSIHQWDGITPWNQYMTISSAYLGPNALPVPEVKNGSVDSTASLTIAFDQYKSSGDKTQDVFLKGVLPLFENKMSVELECVPMEWFKTDTITRDLRAARTKSGKGSAGGDIYLATTLQLIKNKIRLPDMQLRFALRSASGTRLSDARFTDAPGYYFDLSFGKSVRTNSFIKEIRWYGDIGFYTYQTYDLKNLQNDCLMFGGGLTLNTEHFSFINQLAGYKGYLKNGDAPLVYRSELRLLQKTVDWSVSFQQGLHDYDFSRWRISMLLHIPSGKIFK